MKYILDLLNITDPKRIDDSLADFTVTKHSDRCFEISGREWRSIDLFRIWQLVGPRGHVYLFDCETGEERPRRKGAPAHKRHEISNADLDDMTLHLVEQVLQDLESQDGQTPP